jgi:hypothetical protein
VRTTSRECSRRAIYQEPYQATSFWILANGSGPRASAKPADQVAYPSWRLCWGRSLSASAVAVAARAPRPGRATGQIILPRGCARPLFLFRKQASSRRVAPAFPPASADRPRIWTALFVPPHPPRYIRSAAARRRGLRHDGQRGVLKDAGPPCPARGRITATIRAHHHLNLSLQAPAAEAGGGAVGGQTIVTPRSKAAQAIVQRT